MKKFLQWLSLFDEEAKGFLKLAIAVIPLMILFYGLKSLPKIIEINEREKYEKEAFGRILERIGIEEIYQTEEGAKVLIEAYELKYSVEIGDMEYVKTDLLDRMKYSAVCHK